MKNVTGQRFGRLTAIHQDGTYHGRYIWVCKCDCTKERRVTISDLLSGEVTSCGCEYREMGAYNSVISRYKRQAKERNLEWNLTRDQAVLMMQRRCFYCDNEPSNVDSRTKVKYSGIDRIDSKKGYVRSNCVACCVWCNRAKGDRSQGDFSRWIDALYHHYLRDPS